MKWCEDRNGWIFYRACLAWYLAGNANASYNKHAYMVVYDDLISEYGKDAVLRHALWIDDVLYRMHQRAMREVQRATFPASTVGD